MNSIKTLTLIVFTNVFLYGCSFVSYEGYITDKVERIEGGSLTITCDLLITDLYLDACSIGIKPYIN